MTQIKQMPAQM